MVNRGMGPILMVQVLIQYQFLAMIILMIKMRSLEQLILISVKAVELCLIHGYNIVCDAGYNSFLLKPVKRTAYLFRCTIGKFAYYVFHQYFRPVVILPPGYLVKDAAHHVFIFRKFIHKSTILFQNCKLFIFHDRLICFFNEHYRSPVINIFIPVEQG